MDKHRPTILSMYGYTLEWATMEEYHGEHEPQFVASQLNHLLDEWGRLEDKLGPVDMGGRTLQPEEKVKLHALGTESHEMIRVPAKALIKLLFLLIRLDNMEKEQTKTPGGEPEDQQ